MKFLRIALILLPFVILSCQDGVIPVILNTSPTPLPSVSSTVQVTATPSPSVTPTVIQTATPSPVQTVLATPTPIPTSVDNLTKTTLNVRVIDKISKNIIVGAKVEISTLDKEEVYSKKTNSSGLSTFDLLQNISYNVTASADNYKDFDSKKVIIKSDNPSIAIELSKAEIGISGKIVSSNAQPVENALVQVGNSVVLTDSNGDFSISASGSNLSLNISKTGYDIKKVGNISTQADSVKNLGSIVLVSKSNSPVILFDTSKKPFGVSDVSFISSLKDLNSSLVKENFITKFDSISNLSTLDNIDVIAIVSPSLNYSSNELAILENFVRNGKKIIIFGEWGGFGNFSASSLNTLLQDANLKIDLNLIKETNTSNFDKSAEKLLISNFDETNPITKDIKSASFYSSASVSLVSENLNSNVTKLIAFSTYTSFQIKAIYKNYQEGQFGLIGISNIDLGKIVVVGDSSFILSDDSNKNGIKNINESSNETLALNLFKW